MSSLTDSPDGDPGFQVAPMVDVVFVLMLFFMACAGLQDVERRLSMSIPAGGGAITVIAISIAEDGSVAVNDQPMGASADHVLPALRAWLKDVRQQFGEDDPVVIQPAPNVRHDRIVEVLSAISAVGVKKLSFG